MKYFRNPLIVIPLVILLLGGGLYLIFESSILGFILIVLSCVLMIISFIESLFSRKWLKALIYTLFYGAMVLVPIIFIGALLPQDISGTTEFYNNRLIYHLNTEDEMKLPTLCKDENIIGIGPGGGDYSAACIFKLESNDYKNLMSELESSKEFEKMQINNFDLQIELDKLECSKNISFNTYGYQSVNDLSMYSRIVISSDKKYCLFDLLYL